MRGLVPGPRAGEKARVGEGIDSERRPLRAAHAGNPFSEFHRNFDNVEKQKTNELKVKLQRAEVSRTDSS